MRTALVRGPEPRIVEIAAALGGEEYDVIVSPFALPLPPLVRRSLHQKCTRCGGTGLSEPMLDLADMLTKEILSSLPSEGFELPASSVRAWIEQITAVTRFSQA